MSFTSKLKKLRKDPKAFFRDSKLLKVFIGQESNDSEKKVKSSISEVSETKVKKTRKLEPSIIGNIKFLDNNLKFDYIEKKVINTNLGFSTLCVVPDSDDYLINKRFFKKIIKDKNFIAFREKSVYFILEEQSHFQDIISKINYFKIFLANKELRSNLFKDFRNVVVFNPLSESFIFLRETNPFLKTVCVVDSEKSLEFLKNYLEYIDILITYDHFNLSAFKHIPRVLKSKIKNLDFRIGDQISSVENFVCSYSDIIDEVDEELFNLLKVALNDSSYKKDCNLLLPIVGYTDNLDKIDLYNDDNTIDGLIKYNIDTTKIYRSFDEMIENLEIEELYLRDSWYCIYKDLILLSQEKNHYKELLKRTLIDGAYYEKI